MDAKYYNGFSPDTQALVNEIEDALPGPITIELQPGRRNVGCDYVDSSWCILAPIRGNISEGSIIHELLHIRRFAVERVPRLETGLNYMQLSGSVRWMDNAIEHLFILQEEIERWPKRRGYWGNVFSREIQSTRESSKPLVDVLGHSILCYAQAQRASQHGSLLCGWRNCLKSIGKREFGEAQVGRVLAAQSKEEIVEVMSSIYELPSDAIEFS
jgi:hypothetical protein